MFEQLNMNGYFTADFDHRLRKLQARINTLEHLVYVLKAMVDALGGSVDITAVMATLQGTASPEGVVTGVVADQPYTQYDGTHNVIAVWQFRGTLGTKVGWVIV